MSTLLLTLAIAFFIVAIAIALLGIGWLLTGKSKLQAGACGRDPTQKKDAGKGCGTNVSCQLCETPQKQTKKTPIGDDTINDDHPNTEENT